MSETTWTPEKIAELREQLAGGDDGWGADLHPSEVLSLLDELERVTRERDTMKSRAFAAEGRLFSALTELDRCHETF